MSQSNMIPIKFKKKIYISHAYGGKKKNFNNTTKRLIELNKKYPNYLFISPIHSFYYLYKTDRYDVGLSRCLELLNGCDELWVTGKDFYKSIGVTREVEYALEHGIKVIYKLKPEEYNRKEVTKFINKMQVLLKYNLCDNCLHNDNSKMCPRKKIIIKYYGYYKDFAEKYNCPYYTTITKNNKE